MLRRRERRPYLSIDASYLSTIQLSFHVGVRDLPGALQFVRVPALAALVARALGHLLLRPLLPLLPLVRTAVGPLAPAFDRIFQAGSALTKWLSSLVKVIRADPWPWGIAESAGIGYGDVRRR